MQVRVPVKPSTQNMDVDLDQHRDVIITNYAILSVETIRDTVLHFNDI